MSRNPRAVGLTKTEQLRQAKTAAVLKQYQEKETRQQVEPVKTRRRTAYEPKKVDFSKPTMTKAMLARAKQAEKFKQEYERKKANTGLQQPRRTPAPIGGDARSRRHLNPI